MSRRPTKQSVAFMLAQQEGTDITGPTTYDNNVNVAGNLAVTGDVAVNTNKFNVTATNGNVAVTAANVLAPVTPKVVPTVNAADAVTNPATVAVPAITVLPELPATVNLFVLTAMLPEAAVTSK